MSTVAARMLFRRRKLKPELSFGSTSGGTTSLPSNMKANLPELFALLKMQLKPDVPGNATEAAASKHCLKDGILATPGTTPSDKFKARQASTGWKPPNKKHADGSHTKMALHARSGRELRVSLAMYSFHGCHRNLAARTSAPLASPVPSEPGQLQGMSTVAARKHYRRRKLKPKLSFGSTSGGTTSLATNMKANLPELFALLKKQLNPDVPGNATEAAASKHCFKDGILATPETMPSDKCEAQSSSHSTGPATECEASVSEVDEVKTSFFGEQEVVVTEESQPKALAESDVVDIVRRLREVLQEKGPSQEDDFEALTPSQAQLILEVHTAP
ncbi:uncharacterized protein LOC119445049 [Dermacentor silvarum]|uniref:uncharacterized protein LOC119445049 n=1 Tax=Dermacentor silvarum TaxID=543639 RepID=UPI002101C578|nr:uncharacterized protein LOC119445049 [Dermacentor silvarum]